MAAPFKLRKGGLVEARLSPVEVNVVTQVAEQVLEALARENEDTVRLYPPAYTDDDRQQEEFRAMTRGDLTAFKTEAAKTVIRSIGAGTTKGNGEWRGLLDETTTRAWLSVLNDARLVLGTTLAVTDEMEPERLPDDDPRAPAFNLYLYLGGLEETLIDVLAARDLADLPNEEEPWD